MKPAAIVAGVGVLGLVVWGGVVAKHEYACHGLETDYVNEASNLRGSAALRIVGGREAKEAADTVEKMNLEQMKLTLGQIYDECGKRAGETAARKASDELMGLGES